MTEVGEGIIVLFWGCWCFLGWFLLRAVVIGTGLERQETRKTPSSTARRLLARRAAGAGKDRNERHGGGYSKELGKARDGFSKAAACQIMRSPCVTERAAGSENVQKMRLRGIDVRGSVRSTSGGKTEPSLVRIERTG